MPLDYPTTGSGRWGQLPIGLLARGESNTLFFRKVPYVIHTHTHTHQKKKNKEPIRKQSIFRPNYYPIVRANTS